MLKIKMSSPRLPAHTARHASRVAIIGGGYTGAIIAKLLVERGPRDIEEITVFEPREHLGCGLAYDIPNADVRLNVAAHRMRAIPGAPTAFLDWLQTSGTLTIDPQAVTPEGIFARRRDFGHFMQAQLAPHLDSGTIRHVEQTVRAVDRQSEQWRVTGSGGTVVLADILILATGHPPASRPTVIDRLDPLTAARVTDVFAPNALARIGKSDSVLIVGSGLTALDALTRLDALGHDGKITLLSRSGLMPRPHAGGDFAPFGDFRGANLTSARKILATVRATITEAETHGIPWQCVFDALRQHAQELWQGLSLQERQKFLRRLRRWYDVHRYRMPPQASALLEGGLDLGQITMERGHLRSVWRDGEDLLAAIQTREGRVEIRCRHILLATGPDYRGYAGHQRFLLAMHCEGFIQSDPLGLGLACDTAGRALTIEGTPNSTLFVAGPPTRPALGELTGVPEIAAQAANMVDRIIRSCARGTRTIVISQRE
ncbi:FAD/NAD(P)-binding protein [Rhizobium binae]|uniref:FAD/NAD(P)-binding protein n=1 Tax=Rhizobium binae TaxID=1138190 RepID=UPI001C83BE83|nr:FAD/NAD(P)-binding protein [Rhizobium binae]MBX4940715.1 NAD(P)-binding protein [Rhizobium binae]MBX4947244.1 NAD(P)-binding protein [Rhizobium binae]MBX4983138.1 NAD(P)-binding protein [Rhizobium binae]